MKTLITTLILALSTSSVYANYETQTSYEKVTYSEPIYTYVSKNVKECYEVPVKKRINSRSDYSNSRYSNNSIGVDTLIGATVGVVIGNQIGKGNGRAAAKVVGGILGAAVANGARENRNYHRHEPKYETVYETRCETKKHNKKEKIISGYKNYFDINGVQYSKISNHPLRKVKIQHTISF